MEIRYSRIPAATSLLLLGMCLMILRIVGYVLKIPYFFLQTWLECRDSEYCDLLYVVRCQYLAHSSGIALCYAVEREHLFRVLSEYLKKT